jgi:phage-related tail protein
MMRHHTEENMARTSRLKSIARKIGSAVGTAENKARKVAKAGVVAKKELNAIKQELASLRKQLEKTTRHIQKALT